MKTGIRVREAMTKSPVIISPETNLQDCAKRMEQEHVSSVIVMDGEALKGILTEQDIVRKVVAQGKNPLEMVSSEVMETNLTTISPNADLYEAMVEMGNRNIRTLPAIEDGKMAGLVTAKDILKLEPALFEIMAEKIELKEEERKIQSLAERQDSSAM